MADERFSSTGAGDGAQDGAQAEGAGRGTRPAGGREAGGFRIRLSDNEMQAARALQEAFGLRSTVAVLGFSLRTLAQQLQQGQLDELIAQQRAQGGGRPGGPREGGRSGGEGRPGERRRERGPMEQGRGGRARVDPFARPAKPAAAATEEPGPVEPEAEPALTADPQNDAPDPQHDAPDAQGEAPESAAASAPAPEADPSPSEA